MKFLNVIRVADISKHEPNHVFESCTGLLPKAFFWLAGKFFENFQGHTSFFKETSNLQIHPSN